jgi:hypothetical protein
MIGKFNISEVASLPADPARVAMLTALLVIHPDFNLSAAA